MLEGGRRVRRETCDPEVMLLAVHKYGDDYYPESVTVQTSSSHSSISSVLSKHFAFTKHHESPWRSLLTC